MMISSLLPRIKARARRLKADSYALYLAYRHPDTPWYAKILIALVIAYALSPIDLIPDFIPVLGYLDDLLLVPLGIALAIKLIPSEVMAECRERAVNLIAVGTPTLRVGYVVVGAVWLVVAVAGIRILLELMS